MAVESCDFWLEPFVSDLGLSLKSVVAVLLVNEGAV